MPQIKLTETFIRNAKPTDKLQDFTDTQTKGLHLRVTPGGVKSWQYIYRSKITDKVQNDHIGRYPDVSYAQAREHVLGGHKANAASKPVEAFTIVKKNGDTVDEVLARYKADKLSTVRSGHDIFVAISGVVARHKWGAIPLASLSKAMIRDALRHIANERDAKQGALKVQQRISTFLKWASRHDLIEANPIVGGVLDIPVGAPRERTLTEAEIRKLWKACENPSAYGLRTSYARALQLLLVTGARSGMVCGMVDGELHLHDARGPLWDVPGERMKMGLPFVCPLNDLAVSIIRRKDKDCQFVCPTTSKFLKDKNRKPLDPRQLSFVVQGLCETLGFATPFTPHDLRRTASELLCSEFDEHAVSAFLAHETTRGVMKHYNPANRWKKLDEKRAMADRLAVILKGIVGGGEVVPFARAV